MSFIARRRLLGLLATLPLSGLVGCRGSTPTLFGYQLGAGALYSEDITTVYIPQFKNRAFQTTPYRGFEVDVTQAVIDEIGRTTSYRVTSNVGKADTELLGVIVTIDKNIYNRTQQNTVREGELVVGVDIVWRDLRDGTILSAARRGRQPMNLPNAIQPLEPFDPSVLPVVIEAEATKVVPMRITAFGRYLPELGETNASAMDRVQQRLAVQIVSMMEKPW